MRRSAGASSYGVVWIRKHVKVTRRRRVQRPLATFATHLRVPLAVPHNKNNKEPRWRAWHGPMSIGESLAFSLSRVCLSYFYCSRNNGSVGRRIENATARPNEPQNADKTHRSCVSQHEKRDADISFGVQESTERTHLSLFNAPL